MFEFIASRDYHNKTINCQVQHGDSLVSNSSLINVEYSPKLKSDRTTALKVTHGDSFELSCENDSNPKASVKWFFTPSNSLLKTNLHQAEAHLKIHSMNGSSQGTYECRVENAIGTANKEFEVLDFPKGNI